MLFNLQFPNNDGTCKFHRDKYSCLERTNFNAKSYCEWVNIYSEDATNDDNVDSNYICRFNDPSFTLLTIILISWLQLVLTVPIDAVIDYIFDNYILAPTHLAIQDQQKLLHDAMHNKNTNKVTPHHGSLITSFTSIVASGSSNQVTPMDIDTDNDDTSSSSTANDIKSTILVTKEFISRRYKMIVDFLSDHHKHTATTSMDISKLDDTEILFKFYQGNTTTIVILITNNTITIEFKAAFLDYRQTLSFSDRVSFDEAWEPFFEIEHTDSSSSMTTAVNTTNAIIKKYNRTSTVLLKEINKVNSIGNHHHHHHHHHH